MSVAQLGKWGAEGKGDGRFGRAWGIATSWSGGRVHVNDGHGCIQTFSSSGQFQGRVATNCMGPFLAVDSNGIIYALNYDSGTGRNNRVEIYSPDGQRRGVFHLVGQSPRAIDADIYGHNIYVADIGVNQVFRYNQSGQLVSRWGAPGSGNGQFRDPWGIAVDRYHTRRVYVADTGNNRVQAFDSNGLFLFVFGSKGSSDGQFERPVDVAVDTGAGNVYVLDQGNNRIQVFSRDGEFLGKWGSAGYKDGEFNDPYGITIDHQDRVFVMDTGNHRVQIFKAEWR
jgi:tripartite motif-containing protein 71